MNGKNLDWQPIESAPKDGTRFMGRSSHIEQYTGKLRYIKHITWWGKVSHIAIHGWCYGRAENVNSWKPTHWLRDGSTGVPAIKEKRPVKSTGRARAIAG